MHHFLTVSRQDNEGETPKELLTKISHDRKGKWHLTVDWVCVIRYNKYWKEMTENGIELSYTHDFC